MCFSSTAKALRLKRPEETADKEVKEHVSGRIHTSLQGRKGNRAVGSYQKRRGSQCFLIKNLVQTFLRSVLCNPLFRRTLENVIVEVSGKQKAEVALL